MTYGWMPEQDYHTLDEILGWVCDRFPHGIIYTTEIGVRDGRGSRGIHNFLTSKFRLNFHRAIDNGRDMEVKVPFEGCHLIIGNSIEVYNQIPDRSQHFILFDACHNFPITIADFFCYQDKVVIGGYIAFHDTGKQIPAMKDYQGMGDKLDPDMYISCRKAVSKIGLLDNKFEGWRLILDEADPAHDTGGISVFQKTK